MERRVFLGLAAAGALGGCGGFRESRINPRNWFGSSRARPSTAAQERPDANPLIPDAGQRGLFDVFREEAPYEGRLVAEVTALDVERATGGAIIRVSGLASQQQVYDVRLLPGTGADEPVDGVLSYELRAVHPFDEPDRPRKVQAAVFVSDKTLERTRAVLVRGARNERVSRR